MHEIPSLPYKYADLAPAIDEATMRLHHTKHHQTYVDKLNAALEPYPDLVDKSVEELLKGMKELPEALQLPVRNHGGGHWNHSFFWPSLRPPQADNVPVKLIAAAIEDEFGGFDQFKEKFKTTALSVFGSGWCWLGVDQNQKLEIRTTPNQDASLMLGKQAILGLDVWEHAYYLTYQNRRPDYVDAFWTIVNWDLVDDRYRAIVPEPVVQ